MNPNEQNLQPLTTTKAVSEAMEQIRQIGLTDVPQLPEYLFRKYILPIYASTTGQVNLDPWYAVAGSLNRSIDVIDEAGNILFRAPPIQGTVVTNTTRPLTQAVGEIIQLSELKSKMSPKLGQAYMTNALRAIAPKANMDLEPIRQLNIIFKYYRDLGLEVIGGNIDEIKLPVAIEHEAAAKERQSGFTGEYDEL